MLLVRALSGYEPIGLLARLFVCFLYTPPYSVNSGLTKIALFLLVLVSIAVRKVTCVPIVSILQSNPGQELGITNRLFPSSVFMKPKFVDWSIAFMAPVMCGCVWVVRFPPCWIVGLTFSKAFLSSLPGSGVRG